MGEPLLAATPADGYVPREADKTVLYGVVSGHLDKFLARACERDRVVPRFVEREFRAYLECGIAENGSVITHCVSLSP